MQGWENFVPLIAIVVLFWFIAIRPARKRQQEMAATQASVQTGFEVMLGSGIFGTVVSTGDETLQLEVAPGTTIKVARQAIVRVIELGPLDDGSVEPPSTSVVDAGDENGPTDLSK